MYKKFSSYLNETMTFDQVLAMADFILSSHIKPLESAHLLKALNLYKDQTLLLQAFSKALKNQTIKPPRVLGAIDVCGTGGDGHHTFNISTTVSLLLSLVMPVIKHGNTSISSLSGSADVIKAFGIPLLKDAEAIHKQLIEHNFTFLYAPFLHPKMKNIMPIRKKLATPTIFNHIGPLCNPYPLDHQIIGVYDEGLMLPMARALQSTEVTRAAIVYGHQGMDELSASGPNKVIYVTKDQLIHGTIDPKDYKIPKSQLKDYKGGTREVNAGITYDILNGLTGPKQDVVALNAGLALYIAGHEPTLSQGIGHAYNLLNSKEAVKIIHQLSGGFYDHTQ